MLIPHLQLPWGLRHLVEWGRVRAWNATVPGVCTRWVLTGGVCPAHSVEFTTVLGEWGLGPRPAAVRLARAQGSCSGRGPQ